MIPLHLHPRLTFDIGWADLAKAAFAPVGPHRLSEALERLWPDAYVTPGLSVRSLFHALLTAKAFAPGTAIVMSAVNIDGMAEIARHHDLTIHAVDIDPATGLPPPGALLEACRQTSAPICLCAQLFGASDPIVDFPALNQHGVLTVEDAAQAFAGTFHPGDRAAAVSLFSFGPIKRASALGGGLAVCGDASLADRIADAMSGWPELGALWYRKRAVRYLALKAALWPPLFALIVRAIALLGKEPDRALGGAARGFAGADLIEAISRRPPTGLLCQLSRQLASQHAGPERAAAWRNMLGPSAAPTLKAERHASWLAPIHAEDPDFTIRTLCSAGFDATRGATSLRCLDSQAAPGASDMLAHIVYLPHPASLSRQARKRLADTVAELYKRGHIGTL